MESEPSPTFLDVLQPVELAQVLGHCTGVIGSCHLSVASRGASESLKELLPVLAEALPPQVVVIGGHIGKRAPGDHSVVALTDQANKVSLPAIGSWVSVAPLPSGPRRGCTAVAARGEIFVLGGRTNEVESVVVVFKFCVPTGQWSELPPLWTPRYSCAAAIIGDMLCVVGGMSGAAEKPLDSIEAFMSPDGRSNGMVGAWRLLASLRVARGSCAAAALGTALIIAGGRDVGYRSLASAERIDIVGERTAPMCGSCASMRHPRYSCAAAVKRNRDHVLLIVAGGISDGWNPLDSVECYNSAFDSWSDLADMNDPRRDFALVAAAGEIYALGGVSYGAKVTASVERLAIAQHEQAHGTQWETIASMPIPRCDFGAAATWS